jgi:hypothetical protein
MITEHLAGEGIFMETRLVINIKGEPPFSNSQDIIKQDN